MSDEPNFSIIETRRATPNDWDYWTLIQLAHRKAERVADGHLTMLRFTTHWKCCFGTPDRDEIAALQGFPSLREALADLLSR